MATTGVHGLWQGVDVDAARRQQPTWAEEQEGNTRRRPVSAGLAKECVRVVIRVRPMLTRDERLSQSCVRLLHDSNQIVVGRKTAKVFAFDHLFAADSTQTQVFETCALPLLNDVWNGYNATVLAYGQTVRSDRIRGARDCCACNAWKMGGKCTRISQPRMRSVWAGWE